MCYSLSIFDGKVVVFFFFLIGAQKVGGGGGMGLLGPLTPTALNELYIVGFNLNSFQCKQAKSVIYNSFLSCRLAENVSLEY